MNIAGKKLPSINTEDVSLSDKKQKNECDENSKEKLIPHRKSEPFYGLELKSRKVEEISLHDGQKYKNLCITPERLSKKGVLLADKDDQESILKVANLIFKAMNNPSNPLYTFLSGGNTPTASDEAKRIKVNNFLESYDELDLFITLHSNGKKLDTKTFVSDEELNSTFENYGVVILNGLNPDKHSTLMLGCGHNNDYCDHSNIDTLDIRASIKPDVLLQWGDKRAIEYLSILNKYDEIVDEGPLCSFMNYSDDYFSAVRSCLVENGKLRLPSHVLDESKIPLDFIKDGSSKRNNFGSRHFCTTYIYSPG
ncbi:MULTISPECIES: hypothetical protein [unclassified Endozoicomonas]|uniref:hypothetical protein n=1 Tax=unclassified Endozoicomonas TaxID=2644528 RepID=UPI002148766B|nr:MULTISPECIES: hypothetical protein [unclassified Endozoicomonas]